MKVSLEANVPRAPTSTMDRPAHRAPWVGVDEPQYIPAIRASFAEGLQAHVERLREACATLSSGESGEPARAAVDDLHHVSHMIRGTARTLMGVALGEAAGVLSDAAHTALRDRRALREARSDLLDLASDLIFEIERYLDWVDADGIG